MLFLNISGCQLIMEFNVRLLETAWSRVISFVKSRVILQNLFHGSQSLGLKHTHSFTCMYTQEPKIPSDSEDSRHSGHRQWE